MMFSEKYLAICIIKLSSPSRRNRSYNRFINSELNANDLLKQANLIFKNIRALSSGNTVNKTQNYSLNSGPLVFEY